MEHIRLNAYHIMWLFVFFDLPVTTKKERKLASAFRKDLLKEGFCMMQWSVYTRHCPSSESADVHEKRIRALVPDKGQVTIMRVTDKQYGNMVNLWGGSRTKNEKAPQQLELF